MRYNQVIYLIKEPTERTYNPNTGDYELSKPEKIEYQAHINDTGIQTMNNLFGGLKEGAITVRIKGNIKDMEQYSEFEYKNRIYLIKIARNLRDETVLQAVEKQ